MVETVGRDRSISSEHERERRGRLTGYHRGRSSQLEPRGRLRTYGSTRGIHWSTGGEQANYNGSIGAPQASNGSLDRLRVAPRLVHAHLYSFVSSPPLPAHTHASLSIPGQAQSNPNPTRHLVRSGRRRPAELFLDEVDSLALSQPNEIKRGIFPCARPDEKKMMHKRKVGNRPEEAAKESRK